MRLIMQTEAGVEYFALRPCVRESDPSPTDAVRAERGARLYDEQAMHTLRQNRALYTHDGPSGREAVFVDISAHSVVGGAGEGFLKTVKRRLRCAFVHQSEVEKAKPFWERQRLWLSEQLGEPVSYVYRRRAERRRRSCTKPYIRRAPVQVAAAQRSPADLLSSPDVGPCCPSSGSCTSTPLMASPTLMKQPSPFGLVPTGSPVAPVPQSPGAKRFPGVVSLGEYIPPSPEHPAPGTTFYSPVLQFLLGGSPPAAKA